MDEVDGVDCRVKIRQAQAQADIEAARELFQEYASNLEISLCFQNFDQELANLPGAYKPPDGRLLLAVVNEVSAGCVALRKIATDTAEMKRLFVRPSFRGKRLGVELTNRLIDEARGMGYRRILLDTLPAKMERAISMYSRLGFKEIEPYYHNPVEGATFMELDLT